MKIVIVLSPEGVLDKILTDEDADFEILQQGKDDNKIDAAETVLSELDLT